MIELRVIESVDELIAWRTEVIANVFGKSLMKPCSRPTAGIMRNICLTAAT